MSIPSRPRAALDDRVVEALLAGRPVAGEAALTAAIGMLRAGEEQPVPSAALARLLASGVTPLPVAPAVAPGRAVSWLVRGGVALGVVMTSLVGAAAAQALPAPLQRGVTAVVETLTSIDLDDEPAGPTDGGVEPVTGVPASERPGLPGEDDGGASDGIDDGAAGDDEVGGSLDDGDTDEPDGRDDGSDTGRDDREDGAPETPDTDTPDVDGGDAPDRDAPDTADVPESDTADAPDRDTADVPDGDTPESDTPESGTPESDTPDSLAPVEQVSDDDPSEAQPVHSSSVDPGSDTA